MNIVKKKEQSQLLEIKKLREDNSNLIAENAHLNSLEKTAQIWVDIGDDKLKKAYEKIDVYLAKIRKLEKTKLCQNQKCQSKRKEKKSL